MTARLHPLRAMTIVSVLLACWASNTLWAATAVPEARDRLELSMSDPALWVIDTSHLGTSQVVITYDAGEKVLVMTPTWSAGDAAAADLNSRNIQSSNLHLYQLVKRSDCTQAESFFEISVPQAYVDEGRLDVQYTLQGGEADDYLFNGRTFLMKDFAEAKGGYKSVTLKSSDFSEPEVKRRGIQRVGFTLHRNGSMISAPIKIRQISVALNSAKIVPLLPEVDIVNPASFYEFTYTTQAAIDQVQVENSTEARDITRKLGDGAQGMVLLPTWGPDQLPQGHSGVAYLKQTLGTPHNFAQFEVQYRLNIPRAYFDEGKLDKSTKEKDLDVKMDGFRDKIKNYLKSKDCTVKQVGTDFEIHCDKKHVGQVMFRRDHIVVKKKGNKFGRDFGFDEMGRIKAELNKVIA